MTTVVLVDEAEEQLREIDEWWMTHRRAAPTLALDEFDRCVTLLAGSADNEVVYIIAVWGAPKQGDPSLRDPR